MADKAAARSKSGTALSVLRQLGTPSTSRPGRKVPTADLLEQQLVEGLKENPISGLASRPYASTRNPNSYYRDLDAALKVQPITLGSAGRTPESVKMELGENTPLLVPEVKMLPTDLKVGRDVLQPFFGDRLITDAIEGYHGNKLPSPYNAPGGPSYSRQIGSGVWRSGLAVQSKLADAARTIKGQGYNPVGVYIPMGPEATDGAFITQHLIDDLVRRHLRTDKLDKDKLEKFAQAVRSQKQTIRDAEGNTFEDFPFDDFPGLRDRKYKKWMRGSFENRGAVAKKMGLAEMRDMGFPDITALRHAIQEPSIRGLPSEVPGYNPYEAYGGQVLSDIFASPNMLRPGSITHLDNPSYSHDMDGSYRGSFDVPVPRSILLRDYVNEKGGPNPRLQRAQVMGMPIQKVDQQLIDEAMKWRDDALARGIPELLLKYSQGGEVNRFNDGGKVRGKIPAKIAGGLARFRDAPTKRIEDWNWRPMENVAEDLAAPGALDIEGDTFKLPAHVHPFGDFMLEQAKRADTQGLTPRDLVKAYTTTRSSMQRQAINRENLERAGLPLSSGEQMIRPEGAFADWLKTPMGQRYLDAAVKGVPDADAINEARRVMKSFGFQNTLADDMVYASQNIPSLAPQASDLVARAYHGKSEPQEWRDMVRGVKGIDAAKSGFMSSMLGRGDNPTLDARQIQLHTPDDDNLSKYGARSSKKLPMTGGDEAVERLAARQRLLGVEMPSRFDPMYQHLTHHGVWDATSGTKTTHQDIIDMMQGYESGGRVKPLRERMKEMNDRSHSGDFSRNAREFLDAAALAMGTNLSRMGDDGRALDPLDAQYWNPTQGGPLGLVHQTVSFPSDLSDLVGVTGLNAPRLTASDMAREKYSALKRRVAEEKGIPLTKDGEDESWPSVIGDALGTVATQPFAAFSRVPKMAGALSRAARAIPEYIGPFIGMPWRANVAAGTAGGAALHGLSKVDPSILEPTMYSPYDPNDEALARIGQREKGAGMQDMYVPRAYSGGGSVSGSGMNLRGNAVESEPLPKPEIPDLSNMSFEKAFAAARRMGAPTFHWRRAGGKHNTFSTRVAESAGQIERRVNARMPAGAAPTQDADAPMMTPPAPPDDKDQQPGLPMGMPTRNTGDTERMRAMIDEMMREERTRDAEMPAYLYSPPPSQMMSRGGALRRMQRAS